VVNPPPADSADWAIGKLFKLSFLWQCCLCVNTIFRTQRSGCDAFPQVAPGCGRRM